MSRRKYNKQQFQEAIENSVSISECLKKLGLKNAGGNYATFRKYAKELDLDCSHLKGQRWAKNKTFDNRKRPIEDYLSNKFPIQSFKLKNRLLKEEYLRRACRDCLRREWMSEEIPLELHHVDGNNQNNSLDNLQLLCPNCHALTENYRRKK